MLIIVKNIVFKFIGDNNEKKKTNNNNNDKRKEKKRLDAKHQK